MSADVGGEGVRRCGGHTPALLREAMMGGWRDRSRGRDAALRGMGRMLQTCDEKIWRKICKVITQVVPL